MAEEEYWVCTIGPVKLPEGHEKGGRDGSPRGVAIDKMKEIVGEDSDFNCWSGWHAEKKVIELQYVLFNNTSDENMAGCSEIKRLRRENEELRSAVGIILKSIGEFSAHVMDVVEFKRSDNGYVDIQKDGNTYRYRWIDDVRQV